MYCSQYWKECFLQTFSALVVISVYIISVIKDGYGYSDEEQGDDSEDWYYSGPASDRDDLQYYGILHFCL